MIRSHYVLLAEYAREGKDSKFDLLGVFDRIMAVTFPAQHPQMTFVALLVGQGEDDLGKKNANFRFVKPNSEPVFEQLIPIELKITPGTWFASARFVFTLNGLPLPVPGKYQFQLLVDGKIVASHPLSVIQVSPP